MKPVFGGRPVISLAGSSCMHPTESISARHTTNGIAILRPIREIFVIVRSRCFSAGLLGVYAAATDSRVSIYHFDNSFLQPTCFVGIDVVDQDGKSKHRAVLCLQKSAQTTDAADVAGLGKHAAFQVVRETPLQCLTVDPADRHRCNEGVA